MVSYHNLCKGVLAIKKALLYALLKHGHKIGKVSKKTLVVAGAVFAGLATLFVVIIIALAVWIFNAIGSPNVEQAVNTTSQISSQLSNELQLRQFIENGVLNTDAVKTQLNELPVQQLPSAVNALRQEASSLVESGQLLQSEADKLINLLP